MAGPEPTEAAKKLHEQLQKSPFPPADCPVIFADNVVSIARTGGAIKFYLIRFDPSANADNTYNPQYVAQIVLPATGFVGMAVLFEHQLKDMIAKDEIKPEFVDEQRKFYT